jgi:hypothetical protein
VGQIAPARAPRRARRPLSGRRRRRDRAARRRRQLNGDLWPQGLNAYVVLVLSARASADRPVTGRGLRGSLRRPGSRLQSGAAAAILLAGAVLVLFGSSSGGPTGPVAQAATVTSRAPGYRMHVTIAMTSSAAPAPMTATIDAVVDGRDHASSMSMDLSGRQLARPRAVRLRPGSHADDHHWIDGVRKASSHDDHGISTPTSPSPSSRTQCPEPQERSRRACCRWMQRLLQAGSIPIDVWIDAHHLVRRLVMALNISFPGGRSLHESATADFTNYGPQPLPAIPAANQVHDLSQSIRLLCVTAKGARQHAPRESRIALPAACPRRVAGLRTDELARSRAGGPPDCWSSRAVGRGAQLRWGIGRQ